MEEETKEENEKVADDESKVDTSSSSIGQTEKKCETLSVSEVVNHMVTVQVGRELI